MANFRKPDLPLLVFTDLDGTLLNHDDYHYDEALPALKRLSEYGIPLIPVSSKTLVEIETLTRQLKIDHPLIAENGALLAYPANYFSHDINQENKLQVEHLGLNYESIIAILSQLRTKHQFRFSGFNDLSVQQVAEATGLDLHSAANAKNRQASEPLIWQGSDEELLIFESLLKDSHLSLTKGGRFHHVMGDNSKGKAIEYLLACYKKHNFTPDWTIGLGDSDNDLSMLETVDQAVVIRRKDNSHLNANHITNAYFTHQIGPAGWNEFVDSFIKNYSDKFLIKRKKGNSHG